MAITSEIIGKLGGGDVETIEVNRLIRYADPYQVLHTLTVDRPTMIAAVLTHDNMDSFASVNGRAVMRLSGGSGTFYMGSYSTSTPGQPLSVAATVDSGTWEIEATCNNRLSDYTAQTLKLATVPL